MYLDLVGDWKLPPLTGISTAPLLGSDGTARAAEGYDPATGLWCAGIPELRLPDQPTRVDAKVALSKLRRELRTFPFADADRVFEKDLDIEVVDLVSPPGYDESVALVGLMTATCRASLWLAPGFLVRAPAISGAGSGKGLLVRAMCAISCGVQPRAFTKGESRQELDKRLVSDLVEAAPTVFLDNVNSSVLRSETMASVLTERPARVRLLGQTRMILLNSAAFVAVTGNSLKVSGDLARRFTICDLDPQCEDPEQRPFQKGYLESVKQRRAELLTAVLTIWRWGRQNPEILKRGRPLGSFEEWAEWCRDPLVTLGCRDPVDRIESIKLDDPERQRVAEIFRLWAAHHEALPIKAAKLAEPVRAAVDPQRRGRQFVAAALKELAGTRVAGYVLTRQERAGKWGVATFALLRTG